MKKILIFATAFLVVIGVGIRIWYVNVSAAQLKIESYKQSEWVDLNGSFQDVSNEKTQGYSVHVNSAKLKSYKDFMKEYGQKEDYLNQDERPEHLIDLELTIKNDNSDGYINLIQYFLQSKNDIFIMNPELWKLTTPECNGNLGINLDLHSQATIHIPYTPNLQTERELGNYMQNIKFKLVVSKYPIKKTIQIQLEK